jgi:protein-disulfide isomerase
MNEANANRTSTWKSWLELVATTLLVVVTLMVGGFSVMDRLTPPTESSGLGSKPMLTSIPVPIGDSQVMGSRSAKVAVILFSDFQCPFCARAERELLPELESRYIKTGKVLLVWYHDPLRIHPLARGAAEATECAGRQGQFWQLHDWAFAHQAEIAADPLRTAAEGLGLDMSRFDKCVAGEAADKVKSDVALAEKIEVPGTPAWLVGTVESNDTVKPVEQVFGLAPVDVYVRAIDKVIQSRHGS